MHVVLQEADAAAVVVVAAAVAILNRAVDHLGLTSKVLFIQFLVNTFSSYPTRISIEHARRPSRKGGGGGGGGGYGYRSRRPTWIDK